MPLRERTMRRLRSISTTGSPACSVMPCSRVPVRPMQHDVVGLLLARQHRRQQDAVVVAARLGAEHGDVETRSATPSLSSSSTVRMPAMPLPTTTRRMRRASRGTSTCTRPSATRAG